LFIFYALNNLFSVLLMYVIKCLFLFSLSLWKYYFCHWKTQPQKHFNFYWVYKLRCIYFYVAMHLGYFIFVLKTFAKIPESYYKLNLCIEWKTHWRAICIADFLEVPKTKNLSFNLVWWCLIFKTLKLIYLSK